VRKKTYEPRILSWGWVGFHPIQKILCTGGCWVTQAGWIEVSLANSIITSQSCRSRTQIHAASQNKSH
jgi:hypothetical protein